MASIPTWSYSRLKDFEKCPYMAYLKYTEKRPTDHMDTTAADRGTQIHKECEDFVLGKGELTKNMAKFTDYFVDLKKTYELGLVTVEQNWGFTASWAPCDWWDDDIWCRMKLDNFEVTEGSLDEPVAADAVDYKTGKKFGNEIAHGQQGQIYTIGSFLRFPSLKLVTPRFAYLDHGQWSRPKPYTREKAIKLLSSWEERAKKMTEATEFPPKPNKINCRYCPFGPNKGDGSCEWGVDV